MEVDRTSGLEFGCLSVRDSYRCDAASADLSVGDGGDDVERDMSLPAEGGEVAVDVLLGAPPQFAGGEIPDDLVVVAVKAQRLTENRIV